ncbi:alpha-amylase family glycosyl hydrolase [Roseateles oligotrophus]|uniref:Alpha-amylase n=1 Tax=Roseateles oligotrophus TaxID=1769250 RepID=A0ABT2YLD2_9BURK|nr:alpha-amylase family glycosyl hydrolase [Roseateles oligotrophus]MCV2370859.1 alpha-amylase [Roseateles oligotrophus]
MTNNAPMLNRCVLTALLLLAGPAAAAPLDLSQVPQMSSAVKPLPKGWQDGAVFMEIFVRGYQDSDGDGIGDLRGLIQRLDYLQALGIQGIWLMPISPSADKDHGYATTDYRGVEPQYGSLADFDELMLQAHKRGIAVIIDYVINHSAAAHPLFQQALLGPGNPYRDWFVWQQEAPSGWDIWGKNPWFATEHGQHYFGTFGPHMPDFNLKNPAVVDYHRSSLRFWLNRGLDGFRLDAVPHMIENDAVNWNDQPESRHLTHEFQALIKSYPDRYTVCEATANPKVYAAPEVCGSAFAFGLESQVIKAARGEADAIKFVADYFLSAPPSMATMLSNHDIFAGQRVWDQLNGDEARYKLAAATYLLQPGTPFIYYGEEIGMAGVAGLPGDEPLRAPMSWSAGGSKEGFSSRRAPFRPLAPNVASHNAQAQLDDPASILNFYKAMLKLRKQYPALARGGYAAPNVQGQVLSFQRRLGRQTSLVLINYAEQAGSASVVGLPAKAKLARAYPAGAAAASADARGRLTLPVAPLSVSVYKVTP